VLPRPRNSVCEARGQPEQGRSLHHRYLLPQPRLENKGWSSTFGSLNKTDIALLVVERRWFAEDIP